jgi:putative PIN family toxin of toxin-antitoxin system
MNYTASPRYLEIDQSLEKIMEGVPADLINYIRLQFQKNMSNILGKTVEMSLRFVVDTNSIISEIISFVKKGKSALYELTKGAFLSLYAPPKLLEEIEENISEISKKKRLSQKRMIQAWRELFLPKIKVTSTNDAQAILFSLVTVGTRDPEDMPFVALNFSLKTHGIITADKDIIEQPEIRTWKVGGIKKLTTIFTKGMFSFHISSGLIFPLLRAVFQICVSIMKSLVALATELIQLGANLIRGIIDKISKLPAWLTILLGISIGVLLSQEEIRKAVLQGLHAIGESISLFMLQMRSLIEGVLKEIAPYLEFTIALISVLYNNMQLAMAQLQSL